MIREALMGPQEANGAGGPGGEAAKPSFLEQLSRTMTSLNYFMRSLRS